MMDKKFLKFLFAGRIHPEAWLFVRWGIFLILIFLIASVQIPSMKIFLFFAIMATLGILYFFRDPNRVVCAIPGAITSPADGTVVEIVDGAEPPLELGLSGNQWKKIGIFLAPWDVHVNRIPAEGVVTKKVYQEGKFASLASSASCLENEHLGIVIDLSSGGRLACVQIAGFLVRRIICSVEDGDNVKLGQKYGIICFGSHLDLYVDKADLVVLVQEGQKVRAGETVLLLSQNHNH